MISNPIGDRSLDATKIGLVFGRLSNSFTRTFGSFNSR